jgi:hypothetical protein
MTDLQKIRFITANFSALQGLKHIPIGLFMAYAAVFDDAQTGRAARDLTVPCLLTPVFILLYAIIHVYYRRNFGRVESSRPPRAMDAVILLGFLAIAWGAFAVDTLERVPVSFFAIFFALVLFLGQWGMVRQSGGKYPVAVPAGWICIALVFLSAFLPLLGGKAAGVFGFHSAFTLVSVGVGFLFALYGFFDHLFLVRAMAPAAEPGRG